MFSREIFNKGYTVLVDGEKSEAEIANEIAILYDNFVKVHGTKPGVV